MKHVCSALLGAALFCSLSLCQAADDVKPLEPLPALPPLAEGSASIVYKSDGDGMIVDYATTTEAETCKDLEPVGRVFAAELLRKKLLGFVARTVEKSNRLLKAYPQVDTTVDAAKPLQIRGYSSYSSSNGPFRSNGSCGPLTQRFTPQSQHRYQVVFNFVGGGCEQTVSDVTMAEQPVAVEVERLVCAKP